MAETRRVALITGASRGIGAATARHFARAGYDLMLSGVEEAELRDVAREVEALGAAVVCRAGDLADLEFAESLVRSCIERFGRIDVLINNAAWREIKTLREITAESWDRTLRVCLTAPAFMARRAAEDMERRKHGVIVNVSSVQSSFVSGFAAAYVAAKGGLDALTYELAALYGPVGIRALTINPGAIDTQLSNDHDADDGVRGFTEDMIPLGRWGTADEVARVIGFLASDGASYLTGASLVLDGGWSRSEFPKSLKKKMFPGQFK